MSNVHCGNRGGKRRTYTFQFRVTLNERREITACAEALGMSDSTYMLMCHKLNRTDLINRGVVQPDLESPSIQQPESSAQAS